MTVEPQDGYALGYRLVDADPNVPVLVDTMDVTALWGATVELRAWERDRLGLTEGERLIDVGCGLGDAVLALTSDLGSSGEIVGIDVSDAMLRVARERAETAPCAVRFSVGDALALDEPDQSFDAARCERTLQWLSDPQAAVAELARVLRPGGRLSLIDTDWSTLQLDVGDPEITAQVLGAMRVERNRASNVGSRLKALVRAAGLDLVDQTSATHNCTSWDPNSTPAPPGCFSMRSLAEDLVAAGQLGHIAVESFVSTVHDAARAGHFSMSLTMFGAFAAVPPGREAHTT